MPEYHIRPNYHTVYPQNMPLYRSRQKVYSVCNLKATELLDCVLIGVCAVIRSNTVD